MFKFAFGLTSGVIVGVAGSFFVAICAAVVLEDSPETRKMLVDLIKE